MSKKLLLKQYKENVNNLIKNAKKSGLKDAEIQRLLRESYAKIGESDQNFSSFTHPWRVILFVVLILSVLLYVLLNIHTPTSSIVLRNVQGLTYPALKTVRQFSVPIIKLFTTLTDLYDESCLIENPFFYINDMDCWPCENVRSVIDLTGVENINAFLNEGNPFVVKTNQPEVYFNNLQDLFKNYSLELLHDSRRLKISNSNLRTVNEVFSSNTRNMSSNLHIQWRINKMITARVIRKLFPKPGFLPERSGQAVERFLTIDGPISEPYTLPSTECSYVFMVQGSGERTIALKPSQECKNICKTVSVLLRPSYVLVYNWWYWRPVSLPTKGNMNLSISYMNSYC